MSGQVFEARSAGGKWYVRRFVGRDRTWHEFDTEEEAIAFGWGKA